jgi:FlaA1/EpsC-like NDP-sugar epimerase/lipopolysaccharide/colanic/teichoic acid biosynthesis glycosyltransferase
LLILLPLFAAITLAIRLSSRGPVFFRQQRMGKTGKLFHIFKFRTMVPDAEKMGAAITMGEDPRITPIGRFLRNYKLDELPQLLNVLLGDMSLVGPRPEVPRYRPHYSGAYEAVLNVRPGITDPASLQFRHEESLLNGHGNAETFYITSILPEKLRINLTYLKRRSFWTDAYIILLTVGAAIMPGVTTPLTMFMTGGKSTMERKGWIVSLAQQYLKRLRRPYSKLIVDAVLIVLAYFLAYTIRFEGSMPMRALDVFLRSQPVLLAMTLGLLYLFRLYNRMYEYSSSKDLIALVSAHTLGWMMFVATQYMLHLQWTPRSVAIIYWLLGLMFMGAVRFSQRAAKEMLGRPQQHRKRVLVVGAGTAGEMIIRQMKIDNELDYHPVCLVDDNPEKLDSSLHGVPVLGNSTNIPQLVKQKGIEQIVIATPSAKPSQMRLIVAKCEEAKVAFQTVPGPREMMDGSISINQLRSVRIEDLLDREPVRADSERIATYLNGKIVMVTGAGGSIGSELCWQIMEYKPEKLILFDHSENSLFYLENDLKNRWAGGCKTVVGDVCDMGKVEQTMEEHRPSVIFHAAAHKHVPLMELNPEEAIKNNVRGTMTIANAAKKFGVNRFVLISTDKAVEPENIMGASKRLAELYVREANRNGRTKFITVRFGNVLGSNGSVVTLFQKQIARGGPVTVTDPEMTRYFMTIPEAITLILQASTMGEGGEIFVLDMGEPVKVVDMARHLISLSGYDPDHDIPIEFTGVRPGEKIYERLWYQSEKPQRTEFEKIMVARTNGHTDLLLIKQLKEILEHAERMERDEMFFKINQLLPSYATNVNGKKVTIV